jgi:hypothetical protein
MHQKLGFTLSHMAPTLSLENYRCFPALSSVKWLPSAITIKVTYEDQKWRFLISPCSQAQLLLRCNIKYRVCSVVALSEAPASGAQCP